MKADDLRRLERSIQWLEERAKNHGLDFFEMRYEICPADVIYAIAGFGMPTRYSHWSFGKYYHRQKLDFDLGLSRIYELVVNNNPCYAFLLDSNTVIENELVVAHVLGHSDFFKNNARFRFTNRQMVETMAATAERFRRYEERYGVARVEEVIDAAMSIQEHVDPSWRARREEPVSRQVVPGLADGADDSALRKTKGPYDDLWSLDTLAGAPPVASSAAASDPTAGGATAPAIAQATAGEVHPPSAGAPGLVKDVLQYIIRQSPCLEDWERDVVSVIREEMLYFWPQLETKIMNEGWASYWHTELLREMELSGQDAVDFARLTARVTQPNRFALNPYNVGLAIWRDIERRYGREMMFMVRECDSDTSFLRNYLNQDIVEECDLYIYERKGETWVIAERDYRRIRDVLVAQRVNGGFPTLYVVDSETRQTGCLYLLHAFEGQELDVDYIDRTLPRVYRLWGRPVTLCTQIDGRAVEFTYDGSRVLKQAV
ncbi:MAG: SpoVR family protein [Alicyclobacillaceae bacterium]|nr:SpoVR family protein [Alicyclobacillaceae bacterium]